MPRGIVLPPLAQEVASLKLSKDKRERIAISISPTLRLGATGGHVEGLGISEPEAAVNAVSFPHAFLLSPLHLSCSLLQNMD